MIARKSALAIFTFVNLSLWAQSSVNDTVPATDLDEVVVISHSPKMTAPLSDQPLSYTTIGEDALRQHGVQSVKEASQFVPNLFVPDYGSRLTSAMYVRGVGSRINTPSVGLYIDDLAVKEKSAFDFALNDITSISVLRGPQSTLFGRNAMGGMILAYTFNPLSVRQEGRQTKVALGGSTKDARRYITARHADRLGRDAAFSLSAFYDGNDGYNRNDFLHRRSNGGNSGGGKFRVAYNPLDHQNLLVDFQTGLEYSKEHGYDYYKVADLSDNTYHQGGIGEIGENELGSYRRLMFNNNLKLQLQLPKFTLSSITGYQLLDDRMFMDQDFSPLNIFTLKQKQRSNYLSEEIVLRSNPQRRFGWVAGVYIANQWLRTDAPVVFGKDGLDKLIQSNMNRGFDAANAAMAAYGMNIAANIDDETMTVDGHFQTPSLNTAVFGEATLHDIIRKLDLTAGLRLDYEHNKVDYNSGATSNFTFLMMRGQAVMVNQQFAAESRYQGDITKDYTHLLPKLALTYRPSPFSKVYASVSKGFRSGGYNIQMFSDLIQLSLRNAMIASLLQDPTVGAAMTRNGVEPGENPPARQAITYKPETSWNYELGTRASFSNLHLTVSADVFYNKVYDQQIAKFAATGLGRQMVNAGESENYGAEIAASAWWRVRRGILTANLSYGFTHATFTDYDTGDAQYDGNYVPFVPKHTLAAVADYAVSVGKATIRLGADITGNGRIYWTENNSASQDFYILLGAHAGASYKNCSLNIWAKNLTDKSYVPFYFESMSQGFAQTARPRQFGFDLTFNF